MVLGIIIPFYTLVTVFCGTAKPHIDFSLSLHLQCTLKNPINLLHLYYFLFPKKKSNKERLHDLS